MMSSLFLCSDYLLFNSTATTKIYTLSLHDALPILAAVADAVRPAGLVERSVHVGAAAVIGALVYVGARSEEHTSELQSHSDLVCRLLLEKKKRKKGLRLKERTLIANPHDCSNLLSV